MPPRTSAVASECRRTWPPPRGNRMPGRSAAWWTASATVTLMPEPPHGSPQAEKDVSISAGRPPGGQIGQERVASILSQPQPPRRGRLAWHDEGAGLRVDVMEAEGSVRGSEFPHLPHDRRCGRPSQLRIEAIAHHPRRRIPGEIARVRVALALPRARQDIRIDDGDAPAVAQEFLRPLPPRAQRRDVVEEIVA